MTTTTHGRTTTMHVTSTRPPTPDLVVHDHTAHDGDTVRAQSAEYLTITSSPCIGYALLETYPGSPDQTPTVLGTYGVTDYASALNAQHAHRWGVVDGSRFYRIVFVYAAPSGPSSIV